MGRAERLEELGEQFGLLFLEPRDQYDACIIGVAQRFNDWFLVYDRDCIIEALWDEDTTEEDALEHWSYNMVGSWVGEATPAYLIEKVDGDGDADLPVRDLAAGH